MHYNITVYLYLYIPYCIIHSYKGKILNVHDCMYTKQASIQQIMTQFQHLLEKLYIIQKG